MSPTGRTSRQVVIVMTDTTRWDMLGCYRNSGLRTPNLDALASGGVRFERAYTCTPVCGPARSALFTGTWPHGNGSWANNLPLGQGVPTVGERLSENGIRAAYVGKWHLDGTDYFGNGRCPAGWDPDYWFDGRRYLEELSERDRRRSRKPLTHTEDVASDFTFAHRCTDRAVDYLSRYGAEDFLLVISYDEPHDPSISPREYAGMYNDFEFPKSENVWDTLKDKPQHQRVWAAAGPEHDRDVIRISNPNFFGSQSFVDSQIGRVIAAIDEFAPDALVLYTSDHGDALRSHRLSGKGPAMYDEIARIPLIARWRGVTPPGSVRRQPASHIDVSPTVLDVMGLPVPPYLDGRSMIDVLTNPVSESGEPIFCEFGRYEVDHDGFGGFQPMRGVFDGRYKLVVNLLSGDELYDLDADPGELTNLIETDQHVARRDALHDQLLDWMHNTRDPFRGYQWHRRPWRSDAPDPTWKGRGMTRQRPDDTFQPRMIDYTTGMEMAEPVRPK